MARLCPKSFYHQPSPRVLIGDESLASRLDESFLETLPSSCPELDGSIEKGHNSESNLVPLDNVYSESNPRQLLPRAEETVRWLQIGEKAKSTSGLFHELLKESSRGTSGQRAVRDQQDETRRYVMRLRTEAFLLQNSHEGKRYLSILKLVSPPAQERVDLKTQLADKQLMVETDEHSETKGP
ncbi:hypothetical protein NDN08_000175 [Rhodosorus marinus]|uniref:Uncharacterized protein n=1 Tax=Rhodosorus marinus TaxID=101924 RepID=A0AAV8UEK4_9RHOD|nr:hypothetical protein NDN08_000175 [Rhodosorus marinus]